MISIIFPHQKKTSKYPWLTKIYNPAHQNRYLFSNLNATVSWSPKPPRTWITSDHRGSGGITVTSKVDLRVRYAGGRGKHVKIHQKPGFFWIFQKSWNFALLFEKYWKLSLGVKMDILGTKTWFFGFLTPKFGISSKFYPKTKKIRSFYLLK